jgi:RHS repeat-associated protein
VFDNTTLYYVHPDHLDRPVAMTNTTAMTLAWQARYDPFGNPVTVTVSPVMNMRLPGQWFQIEDGLSYNWHRTYDPGIGRYSQADPLGFVDGPNVYAYLKSSPVMKVDADGLMRVGPMSKPENPGDSLCKPTPVVSDCVRKGALIVCFLMTGKLPPAPAPRPPKPEIEISLPVDKR